MATLFLGSSKQQAGTAELKQKQVAFQEPTTSDDFFAERVLALSLIGIVAFWLRARDPGYTTAYMDESVYVVYGRMFLARHFEAPLDYPLRWSFGWYLWPVLAALADRVGGIIAVREMSAVMGTAVVMAVYGFSRRLLGAAVAMGSAAIFAMLGPAVMASRIATRDAGSIFFLAFGLWAFARAWQEDERQSWLLSAVLFFAAFLCKYVVAIYFPFLFLLALFKRLRAFLYFCLPILAACAGYLAYCWGDLKYLIMYGTAYGSLRAPASQVWDIYVARRVDLWLISFLGLFALVVRGRRTVALLLWLAAAAGLAFQWKTRADFDFWKHATYALLFLTPLAVHALIAGAKRIARTELNQTVVAIAAIVALCLTTARAGKSMEYDRVVFWPNVEPILAYFEGRTPSDARILVDDSVFRYYLAPPLSQSQIVDPFYLRYEGHKGAAAYSSSVEDGWFDYVILDGGMGAEANAMRSAIAGHLGRYTLRMALPDPTLGHSVEIYERTVSTAKTVPANGASVSITMPTSDSAVNTVSKVSGTSSGAGEGWYVRLEVFSDRWYSLGKTPVLPNGSFESKATFGGQNQQACHHMLRARLYDDRGRPRAVSLVFNLRRADIACP